MRPPVLKVYGLLVLGTEPCLHFSGRRTDLPAAPCWKPGSLGEERVMSGGYCFSKQWTFSFPSVGRDAHTQTQTHTPGYKHTETHTTTQTQMQTHTRTWTHRQTHRDTRTQTHTHKDMDTQTYIQTYSDTHICTRFCTPSMCSLIRQIPHTGCEHQALKSQEVSVKVGDVPAAVCGVL